MIRCESIALVLLTFVLLSITAYPAMAAKTQAKGNLTPKQVYVESTNIFTLEVNNTGDYNITRVVIRVNPAFKNVEGLTPPGWSRADFGNNITWIAREKPIPPSCKSSFSYKAKAPSKTGTYKHQWEVKDEKGGEWKSDDTTSVVTEVIPEFTTIAIPAAAVLVMIFLMSRRKRKE